MVGRGAKRMKNSGKREGVISQKAFQSGKREGVCAETWRMLDREGRVDVWVAGVQDLFASNPDPLETLLPEAPCPIVTLSSHWTRMTRFRRFHL